MDRKTIRPEDKEKRTIIHSTIAHCSNNTSAGFTHSSALDRLSHPLPDIPESSSQRRLTSYQLHTCVKMKVIIMCVVLRDSD